MATLDELRKMIYGKAGRTIDVVGSALGNIVPEAKAFGDQGLSGYLESVGSETMTPEERIANSIAQTGAVAEGDYAQAVQQTGSPYIASRAEGGILTPQAVQQNNNSVTKTREEWLRENVNPDTLTTDDGINFRRPTPAGGGTPGVDFNALLQQQRALARSYYDEGVRRAGAAFDRARGLFDEGIQTLGKKRGEFKTTYDTGNNDILTSYEGSRGNLQSSAKNAATKSANLIRAMGLGGSAILRSEGQQKQDQARQLGSLNVEKTANERENLKQFNANQDWANLQESSLHRGLRDAQEARTAAENQAGLIEAGDYQTINERMGNYLNTILQNQLALDAANSGVASKTVNPYAVNISDMVDSLSAAVPTIGGQGGASGVQNVNIDPNNLTLEQLRKLGASGVAGAGLYR